jgi:hypothetical protein
MLRQLHKLRQLSMQGNCLRNVIDAIAAIRTGPKTLDCENPFYFPTDPAFSLEKAVMTGER